MLTQLPTVKSRLALTVTDYDDLLTNAIKAVSDRFDKETNRTLVRTTALHALQRTRVSRFARLPTRTLGNITRHEKDSSRAMECWHKGAGLGWGELTSVVSYCNLAARVEFNYIV